MVTRGEPGAGAKSQPQPPRESKRQGELVEIAFMHKAAAMGFGVAKPYGDSERYDFMLDSGKDLWRVQVKSTSRMTHDRYLIFTRHSAGPTKQAYSAEQIDFLVAFVIPENAWYVLPVRVLEGRQAINLYPHRQDTLGEFERFREAWCLMACPLEGPCRSEIQVEPLCHPGRSDPTVDRTSLPLRERG